MYKKEKIFSKCSVFKVPNKSWNYINTVSASTSNERTIHLSQSGEIFISYRP